MNGLLNLIFPRRVIVRCPECGKTLGLIQKEEKLHPMKLGGSNKQYVVKCLKGHVFKVNDKYK